MIINHRCMLYPEIHLLKLMQPYLFELIIIDCDSCRVFERAEIRRKVLLIYNIEWYNNALKSATWRNKYRILSLLLDSERICSLKECNRLFCVGNLLLGGEGQILLDIKLNEETLLRMLVLHQVEKFVFSIATHCLLK